MRPQQIGSAHTAGELSTAEVRRRLDELADRLRARHTWLRHQDAIGAGLMAAGLATMMAVAWGWHAGLLGLAAVLVLNALASSVIHELEHDLIHRQYFKRKPWAHHLMLGLCWIARPTTVNPWLRCNLHLHHHKVSGSESDVEERGLTNGEPWGVKRLVMTLDAMLALALRPVAMPRAVKLYHRSYPQLRAHLLVFAYFPLGYLAYGAWYACLYGLAADALLAAGHGVLPTFASWGPQGVQLQAGLEFVAATWLAPNLLRSACLYFISSNMHYYGDIDPRNVRQQTQVLDSWWLLPFNLFCCNFGATHSLHHYQVGQPFYVRALIARPGNRVLAEAGVRFNDWGTFTRANRWTRPADRVARATAPAEPVELRKAA
jgi:hypothetical protein